jgi:hypothetical protein
MIIVLAAIELTANGSGGCVPWQGVESLSAEAIERHVGNRRRIAKIESSRNDEVVVVAIQRSQLTPAGRENQRIGSWDS